MADCTHWFIAATYCTAIEQKKVEYPLRETGWGKPPFYTIQK
jgi:hypothetical protein